MLHIVQSNLLLTDTSIIWIPLSYRQFVWSQKCQKSYIPYLYNTDTSVKWTLGSVNLVSVLKRFDCTRRRKRKLSEINFWIKQACRDKASNCQTSYSQLYLKWTPLGLALVSVLERCPSYRESTKRSKERHRQPLGLLLSKVSAL